MTSRILDVFQPLEEERSMKENISVNLSVSSASRGSNFEAIELKVSTVQRYGLSHTPVTHQSDEFQ